MDRTSETAGGGEGRGGYNSSVIVRLRARRGVVAWRAKNRGLECEMTRGGACFLRKKTVPNKNNET